MDGVPLAGASLGPPVTEPKQVFGVGLNYVAHADETRTSVPDAPVVFAKFPSCLAGPEVSIEVGQRVIDWETELVVVMAQGGRDIDRKQAWAMVAGLTVGQDLSERVEQLAGPTPQWSLAKSHARFGPLGPVLVTVDEFQDPDDLAMRCTLNGEVVQSAQTSQMIFPVPELIAWISARVELCPGDVIFTGTPEGVGMGLTPPRYLQAGDLLVSELEGIGRIVQHFC
jgi:2-keto-4-pentenoate hydratase/2-oxohepta-3-ene-1,7-dioic acid hydratase in catechol pathway